MNFARDIVDAARFDGLAILELTREGSRREWTFGEVANASSRLAGELQRRGVGRGDVVMTLVGNRAEWVLTMVACFRIGAVVLPCNEQLRSKDLRMRMDVVRPRLIVADDRNRAEIEKARPQAPVVFVPDPALLEGAAAEPVELAADDPCLLSFTSGTAGPPKAVVHAQRYLLGQMTQAEHWLDARPGDLVWCTAASGWSKSARNVFIAPWLRGACALLHDARFDPAERLQIIRDERVDVLCMAPTEYRVIANRTELGDLGGLRSLVAAGEALDPHVIEAWHQGAGVWIRDGFGQTETGQVTGAPYGEPIRPGSMGRPLPGVRAWVDDGELVIDPSSVPTFFLGYLGDPPVDRSAPWRTGDRVEVDEDGFLFFEGRTDDVIISSGYRIGPFEVESVLSTHPAVAEAAVVAAADPERGSIVHAILVLHEGYTGSPELVAELQSHVQSETAPYKYPRRIDFVGTLPKTHSGKIQRARLRESATAGPPVLPG